MAMGTRPAGTGWNGNKVYGDEVGMETELRRGVWDGNEQSSHANLYLKWRSRLKNAKTKNMQAFLMYIIFLISFSKYHVHKAA